MKPEPPPASSDRIQLAAAHRLAHRFGMTDLIHTHISARVEGHQDRFLITPYGRWFQEVTARGLSEVDAAGALIKGASCVLNPAGFTIHEAVYSVRPDVMAVFHAHTLSGVAVSAMAHGVRPISQYAIRFFGQVAYHDYRGATLVSGERESIQQAVSDPNIKILVLRNHGLVTLANSIPEVFLNMYFLDRACRVQMLCESGAANIITPEDEICRLTASQFAGSEEEDMQQKLDLEWTALLRLIKDQEEDYSS